MKKPWISYVLMPVATFIDQLHHESGIFPDAYDVHRFYISSIHVVVWLRISVLLSVVTFIGFIHPTVRLFDQIQTDFAYEQRKQVPFMYVLTNIPSQSHLKWFIFVEIFCVLHVVLTCLGIRKGIPLFFAPSQIILLVVVVKLFCNMVMSLMVNMKDTFDMIWVMNAVDFRLRVFNSGKEDHFDNIISTEGRPIARGFVDLALFLAVVTFEYLIERCMQSYKYEECVADFRKYLKTITEQERQRDMELYWVHNQQMQDNQTWACEETLLQTAILNTSTFQPDNHNATCNF